MLETSPFLELRKFRLEKLLYRESIELASTVLTAVLLIATLLLFAATVWTTVSTLISTPADIAKLRSDAALAPGSGTSEVSSIPQNYKLLSSTTVFGELKEEQTNVVEKPVEPAPELNLTLIGTYLAPAPEESLAIVEDTKGKLQDAFGVGETIFDRASLKAVFPDKIEVLHNGKVEVLVLDESVSQSSVPTVGAVEQIVVDEDELSSALENLPLLLTQARAVPYFQDGKSVGLRLFAIRSGSLFEKVGLRNGDILKSINGNNLGDMTQALRLFEKLKEQRNLSVVVERNRKEMTVQYSIR